MNKYGQLHQVQSPKTEIRLIQLSSMPLMLAGNEFFTTIDNEEFIQAGSTPTQINQIIWQGLPGVYLAATNNGLMKSVDFGQTWDYIRPNATFGTTWPAGAVGRQVSFSVGPRECPENTDGQIYGYFVNGANDTWSIGRWGGSSWTVIGPGPTGINFFVTLFKRLGDYFYIVDGVDLSLYRSADGVTWSLVHDATTDGIVDSLDIDAAGNLWAIIRDVGTNARTISKSTDFGASWTVKETMDIVGDGAMTRVRIACHPTNPLIIAVTGSRAETGTLDNGSPGTIQKASILISTDGDTFTQTTPIPDLPGSDINDPGQIGDMGAWDNASSDALAFTSSGRLVVAMLLFHLVATGAPSVQTRQFVVGYSDNYTDFTWETLHNDDAVTDNLSSAFHFAHGGLFLVANYFNGSINEGLLWSSTDGSGWATLAPPGTRTIEGIYSLAGELWVMAYTDGGAASKAYRRSNGSWVDSSSAQPQIYPAGYLSIAGG